MEKDQKKIIAAAMAGVMHYIQDEEAAAERMPPQTVAINMWGASGRQAMMQMRGLMEMKIFRGLK